MAKLRFAILKSINNGVTEIAKLTNGEYLEYDIDVFKDKVKNEVLRIAASGEFGKQQFLKKTKQFTNDEIATISIQAIDKISKEIKENTVRIKVGQ